MRRYFKFIALSILFLASIMIIYAIYPETPLSVACSIDSLVVDKSKHTMCAFDHGRLLKTYTVALGQNPKGHKQQEGDKRTPEGRYTINDRNPKSDWYKNLGISYPNMDDLLSAKKRGVSPGGSIKIHGLKSGWIGKFHRWKDWTAGCIAVTNQEMEELYTHVKKGAVIIIQP